MVKNDYLFLNHIIVGHYWSSFSCGKCLKFVATNGQQLKRHIPGCGKPKKECKKKCSTKNKVPEVHSSSKSGYKSKKMKKKKTDKEGVGAAGRKKPHGLPTKSSMAATSQEQAPNTLSCSACKTTSIRPRSTRSQRGLNRVLTHMCQKCSVHHDVLMHRVHPRMLKWMITDQLPVSLCVLQ